MDLSLLGKLLNLKIIDKKDSHNYSPKLDFSLFSKISLGSAQSLKTAIHNNPPTHKLGNSMSIYVVGGKCNQKKIICSPKDKIEWIKEKICYECQINDDIQLLFCGNILEDDELLENYDVENGDVLNYVGFCMAGGTNEFYLSDDLLDPCYDYDFTKIKDDNKKYYRGGLEYKRPCGWKRYALKVAGKFENDLWLGDTGNSNNDSEWAVSYHGTKQEFADSICKKGLFPGNNNLYGVGVYCTPNIETAASYSKTFEGLDGEKYKIVFQNRVKPSSIKKASDKGGPDDYWYIENSKDIRPYSICIKKC